MKKGNVLSIAAAVLLFAAPTFAWNCPSGQIRQQAPVGTPTNTPYYDVVEGIAFICVPNTPTPSTTGQTQSQTQNQQQSQQQSQANSQNSTQNTSNQNVSSSGSTSKSTSGVNNSGNSKNTNSNTNTFSPVLNSSNTANSSSNSATTNSGNSTSTSASNGNSTTTTLSESSNYQESKIPVNTAYAAAPYPTAQCFKGGGIGGQAMSFGFTANGGRIDENCARLETARSFDASGEFYAGCKVKVNNKYAKEAGVSLDDCLKRYVPPVPVMPLAPPPPAPVPVIVNLPPPTINITPTPVYIDQAPTYVPQPVYKSVPRKKSKPIGTIKPCPVSTKNSNCWEND